MVKYHAPRHGSLGFRRKRARRIYPNIISWPKTDRVGILGYPVYKVGMVSVLEKNLLVSERAMWHGIERVVAATVLEAPPLRVLALRAYTADPYGLKVLNEVWTPYWSTYEKKYLKRKFPIPKKPITVLRDEAEKKIGSIEDAIDEGKVDEIRAIVRTSPNLTTLGKKKPEVLEIKIGGENREAFKWGMEKLGRFVRIFEVFEPGTFVDVIGVTKGKGFASVIKRFGVKLLPEKFKKGHRKVGSLGPWTPARIMWTVPRPGQLGFFRRTEFNKQIVALIPHWYNIRYNFSDELSEGQEPYELGRMDTLRLKDLSNVAPEVKSAIIEKLGLKPKRKEAVEPEVESYALKMTPSGGWPHYGIIQNDVVIIRGSCQGPPKRLLVLRYAVRSQVLRKDVDIISIYYGRELLLSREDIASVFELANFIPQIQFS
ncbi:MAG: 50S ribosomal protein L3 [Crenarchaeota archaeon]|nr:50S ribosomal protein L3 [Thermoproteota archaeon]MCR8454817.1 50S ribosomal protein L3 [Thermoproteota archaeon]MCR8501602.1 50S ribosomal protein L3 [Thermoproteota archaeon]